MYAPWPLGWHSFQHTALTTQGEFRLIKFPPAQRWWSTLECEVHHFRLSDHPQYTALSYTSKSAGWSEQAGRICCNGRHLQVPRGLLDILYRIISGHDPVYVWIDQLCIDQDNWDEKATQIRLMKDIFKNASETIIWLGDAPSSPQLVNDAFVLLRHIHFRLSPIEDRNALQHLATDLTAQQSFGIPQVEATLGEILRRPWFSRVWVLQEATLSSNAVVHCGSTRIRWNNFCEQIAGLARMGALSHFLTYLEPSVGNWQYRHIGFLALYAVFLSQRAPQMASEQPRGLPGLKEVLHISRRMDATDQRDRIYAILGLCFDADRVKVSYDDSYSVANLFYDVALYFLTEPSSTCSCCKFSCPEKQLSILGDAGIRNMNDACFRDFDYREKRALNNLPSWVPMWVQPGPETLWFNSHNAGYDAAGNTVPIIHVDPQGPGSQQLHLVGAICDQVYITTRPCPNPRIVDISDTNSRQMQPVSTILSIGRWLQEVFIFMQQNIPESTSRTEKFCRTLCANSTHMESSSLQVIPKRTPITDGRALVRDFEDYMSVYSFIANNIWQPHILAANINALRCYEQGMNRFFESSILSMADRQLFITNAGRTGIGPAGMQLTDMVCIFTGAPMPVILRPAGITGQYRLVGECYVHGLMNGEVHQLYPDCMDQVTLI